MGRCRSPLTIPIAIFMGCYLRFPSRAGVGSFIDRRIGLLPLAVVSGDWVALPLGLAWFSLSPVTLCWLLLISYGFAASVLPVAGCCQRHATTCQRSAPSRSRSVFVRLTRSSGPSGVEIRR